MAPALAGLLLAALAGCATAAGILYPVNKDALKARAGDYTLDPRHTSVIFAVEHLGFSLYYGRFEGASGRLAFDPENPSESRVAVRLPAAGLDVTDADLEDMLKGEAMFDAAHYPDIVFESDAVTLTGENSADIHGLLTIKDATRPLVIQARFHGGGTNPAEGKRVVGFDGEASLKRSDFGLDAWLPFVGDEARLTISAEFTR
ncbi:MAG: YceI family protein [Amphiplicatus sp.]